MRNTLETRLGLFIALAFVAAIILFEMIGSLDLFSGGYRLQARFSNAQELKEGDPVKMAGVDIGRVEKIGFADNKVEITMKVRDKANIRTDSKASIHFVGLLGQNYVSIGFGTPTAPRVTPGTLLETIDQPDLNSVLAKLDSVATGVEGLTTNFSGGNIANLLGPFTDFLTENKPKLSGIVTNVQVISSNIAEGKGTVGKLINDDQLYRLALGAVANLNATADELKLTLAQARTTIDSVNQGQGTIGKLTKDPALFVEATNAVTNLREIFQPR